MTQGLRILVVEDDALIAMDLAELLIGLGHDVYAIASTEQDAVQAAARLRPDMMIVDAHLREGSGIAAVDAILAQGFVAHLFVTGDPLGMPDVAVDAIIVPKPYSIPDLLNGIKRASQAAVTRALASQTARRQRSDSGQIIASTQAISIWPPPSDR